MRLFDVFQYTRAEWKYISDHKITITNDKKVGNMQF